MVFANSITFTSVAIIFLGCQNLAQSAPVRDLTYEDSAKTVSFLRNFGYIEASKDGASSITAEAITQAILDYQDFFGLNQTGIIDEETLKEMEAPRCANPDKFTQVYDNLSSANGNIRQRRKRSDGEVKVHKWHHFELTYKISNYPKLLIDRQGEVDGTIQRALDAWSEVTRFVFTKTDGDTADIMISWAVRKHCGGGDFDGPNNVLAHAFYPEKGMVHFDDDEDWTLAGFSEGKVDLYSVALHEFGHTLGLGHDRNRKALMFPTYGASNKLHQIDVSAIKKLYGDRTGKPPAESPVDKPTKRPDEQPNLCVGSSFDAITMSPAGEVLIFKNDWYWLLNEDADDIVSGYPRLISKDWPDLPRSLDAALTANDGRFYFFKGDKYWRFKNKHLDDGYPKLISDGFPGIPNNLDGAFIWSNDKAFFFKDDQYWRFDHKEVQKVKSNYPELVSAWRGVPAKINDVFRWNNNVTYFFKDELYYRYNDETDEVESNGDPAFPRLTADWWLGCGDSISQGATNNGRDLRDSKSVNWGDMKNSKDVISYTESPLDSG